MKQTLNLTPFIQRSNKPQQYSYTTPNKDFFFVYLYHLVISQRDNDDPIGLYALIYEPKKDYDFCLAQVRINEYYLIDTQKLLNFGVNEQNCVLKDFDMLIKCTYNGRYSSFSDISGVINTYCDLKQITSLYSNYTSGHFKKFDIWLHSWATRSLFW